MAPSPSAVTFTVTTSRSCRPVSGPFGATSVCVGVVAVVTTLLAAVSAEAVSGEAKTPTIEHASPSKRPARPSTAGDDERLDGTRRISSSGRSGGQTS